MTTTLEIEDLYVVPRLAQDIRADAALLDQDAVRAIVNTYYDLQNVRIGMANIVRTVGPTGAGVDVPQHFAQQFGSLEKQLVGVLDAWSDGYDVGRWAKTQYGIGPVISAGLLAHIDIEQAPTVSHIWSFAGLKPPKEISWGRGEKRPYNAKLKVLCYKIGDSFVKFSGSEKCIFGHLYRARKAQEVERNEAGEFADQADETLKTKKIRDPKTRKRYEEGRLPDGRIDLRARRWAVKLFLATWHEVAYIAYYGEAPPAPYPIAHLGHEHKIEFDLAVPPKPAKGK